MAFFRKIIGVFIIIAALLAGSVPFLVNAWPAAASDGDFEMAPINPEALEPAGPNGYIAPPMDLSHLDNTESFGYLAYGDTPTSYDWRDYGAVTTVKDQGSCGTCWAFGTTSVLESAVLIDGESTYDFSEQSVALCADRSLVYLYDDSTDPCLAGGNSFKAAEVFIKKGAVLESCNPYDTSGLYCDGSCSCDSCPTIKQVTGYRYVTGDSSQTDLIKTAVYDIGPVTMAFYSSGGFYEDPDASSYDNIFDYYECPENPDHMVTIVGWDDDVPHPDPDHDGTGAWLVKNSWDTDWGNDGYFWLAYDSSAMCEIAYLEYKDYNADETLYYWDEAGRVTAVGAGNTCWMASLFTSAQAGELTHVDFWTTSSGASYEISVYDDDDPSDGLSSLQTSQTGSCDEMGYYSIALNTPVSLASGQQFTVAVEMTTPGYDYPIACEAEDTGYYEPPIQTGVNFLSTNGSSWEDAADYSWNICLRARVLKDNTPPVVSNVSAAQGTGTGTVNITYNVADESQTQVSIGFQYWDGDSWETCTTATGDGTQSTGTGKTGTWDAAADFSGHYMNNTCQIRVTADDGQDENNTGSADSATFTLDTAAPTGCGCSSPADSATKVSVEPTLTATAATDNSTPVAYFFQLATNTSFTTDLQASGWQTGTTWSPATLYTGTQYYWRVRARDSFGNAGDYGSYFGFSTNNLPTAPSVSISPGSPKTDDNLTCNINTASTDADGDPIEYSYSWYKNGKSEGSFSGNTVDSTNTAKGDTWKCVVTPYDGTDYGTPDEAEVTIGNTAPSIDSVTISPDPADTDDDLTATPSGWSDLDYDTAGYQWQWQRWNGSAWADISGATTGTLDSSYFVKDDRIQVTCTPYDGDDTGSSKTDEITISNALPTAPVVDVTPDDAVKDDDLTCTITTPSSDGDGDTVTYTYEWYKNDVLQHSYTVTGTTATSQTIDPATAKGEVWKCTVTPNDTSGDGPAGEAQVTIGNIAPTAPVVDVTPDSPVTGDGLTCTVTTPSSDADGDTVAYSYAWYKDGSLQSGLTTNTVSSIYTSKGEEWQCIVTPNDGDDDGPSDVDTVTIGNTAPPAPVVDVTPDDAVTGDDLTCNLTTPSTDVDGDTVTYAYAWYKGGDLQAGLTGATVSSDDTARGDAWQCVVTPSDGTVNGPSDDDTVTIGNSLPVLDSVAITPKPVSAGNTLTATPSGWSDGDGDPAGYDWQWQKWNGAAWEDIAGAITNTLSSASFADSDLIRVACTPNDGINTGATVYDEVTIGAPYLSGGLVSPETSTTAASFVFSVTYTDPDDDLPASITVTINGGTPADMTEEDSTDTVYSDGKVYNYTIDGSDLGEGTHTFRFAASDGTSAAGGDTDSHDGPTVNRVVSGGGGGAGGGDTTAPRISEITVGNITRDSAVIYWKTQERSTSQVEYWASPSQFTDLDEERVISHEVTLTGLSPATTYHYRVLSRDLSENLGTSEEMTFKTEGTPASFTTGEPAASPAEAGVGETVTVTVPVTNTGESEGLCRVNFEINGEPAGSRAAMLAGGQSGTVTFTTSQDSAGTYEVSADGRTCTFTVTSPEPTAQPQSTPGQAATATTPDRETNWWLIGGIIAACVVAALPAFFLIRRKRAS